VCRFLAVLLLPLMACGPLEEAPTGLEAPLDSLEQAQMMDNGLSLNGLSLNGLSLNGLSLNGLSLNGLSTQAFKDWFNADPALHNEVMRYIVRCAVAPKETRSFTSELTGTTYTWTGELGLALNWASGAVPTVAEQQVVSACLAAHVNTYGVSVPISVLGLKGDGKPIPIQKDELNIFDKSEACFFGNLFTGEGIYVGNDRTSLGPQESTSRRCALSPVLSGTDPACPPVKRVGRCEALSCQMDPNSKYYTRCTYNGVVYRPLTTRIRSAEIVSCGDGICQVSESCGTGSTPDNCGVDCGSCP
jgi:hypothetical protein